MSDVNVAVSVSDESVDQTIAKIEGGLDKLSQLQSQMAVLGPDALAPAVPARRGSVGVAGAAVGVGAGVAGLSTAQAKVNQLKNDVKDTTSATEKLMSLSKTTDVKGLQSAAYRITRMIPGLREANRLAVGLKNFSAGNVVGLVSIAFLILRIYQTIKSMLDAQRREQEQFRQDVIQMQNFTSIGQFNNWQMQQRQAVESYRTGVIP